jgi:hypothetical protein
MAGRGERFRSAGYTKPKWAIEVPGTGKSLLWWSIKSIADQFAGAKWAFVVQNADICQESLEQALEGVCIPTWEVISLSGVLNGPLVSLWQALDFLGTTIEPPVLVQVCDTYVNVPPNFCGLWDGQSGVVFSFSFDAPNLCHIDVDAAGFVVGLREKVGPLVGYSSTGTFIFPDMESFRAAAKQVLRKKSSKDEAEYFISDVVNYMMANDARFMSVVSDDARPIGTPDELNLFAEELRNMPRSN